MVGLGRTRGRRATAAGRERTGGQARARVALACALALVVGPGHPLAAQSEAGAPARVEAAPGAGDATPGAALRAGVEALRGGRFEDASERLAEVERRWPWLGDHAARLGVEAALGAGRAADAFSAASHFPTRYPDSALRPRVARLRGDAARASGRPDEARRAWREALAGTDEPAERAALLFAVARAAEEAGDARDAAAAARDAWITAPTTPDAEAAEALLARLEAAGRVPARSASDWSRRGDALLGAGAHEAALAAYERALALAPPAALARAVRRQQAFALFRARRYADARASFEALGDDPEARFYAARATARSGEPAAAIEAFEAIGAGPSPFAAQARLLAATLLDDVPATEEAAAAHYRAVAASAGDAALRRDAHWRLAWLRYRAGRYDEAAAELARQAADEADPIEALRPRYWALRARERAGEGASPALVAAYAELAREYPLAYYGWRASLRAPRGHAAPASLDAGRAPSSDTSALPAVGLARVEALLEATLHEEADAELAALAGPGLGDADRERLAALAASAQSYARASAIAGGGRSEELARGPAPGAEGRWRLAWPRAYEADVTRAAAAAGIRPELAWSIMREESAYEPTALSPVGARGLLQLMPETAARVAPGLGLAAPGPEALYEPALNVRLGTALLGELARDFGGRLPLAIGSYNAGEGAVRRWLEQAPALAEDEWIEAIPYDETRAYVRRVLRSLRAYELLYAP